MCETRHEVESAAAIPQVTPAREDASLGTQRRRERKRDSVKGCYIYTRETRKQGNTRDTRL